ncbi:fibronectin type III domain-containing protein [Granulicella mallensis]|uniref:Fibronectin type-III domain-containing protein n=1 Tax=Granulicella mallensis TaxID=940614 RepID=A0A7W8EBS9_9BACT|nr:fibronectin type III domain-containing protein [Granulicella mallensis]MBB5066137.1 hypothetical protein [Granulicella mallensis]
MSKALVGASELIGAVGMGVAAFLDPALVASPWFDKIMASLAISGISMEAGAIANALTANRGVNITTRQAASYRQIIYGIQRVGGIQIYRSTTGGHHDQFNYVIVIATHECFAIENLYLDGRQVYWDTTSAGNTTQNGYNFGGNADGNSHQGPNGVQYNFGTLVYCEARYGEQLPGDVIGGLTANDPTWAASSGKSPFVGGCTYVYLKVEYDSSMFPSEPEVRFTVHGKPVVDPRVGTTPTYSANAALIINDVLTDPEWGLGDDSVNQDQLIAAANICDEQVALAAGGTESRYSCHWHYDTGTAVGDIISTLMESMGGKISRIGGQWFIYPAAYYGPSASFNSDHLIDSVDWTTKGFRDISNLVRGKYTAPNFPFNVAGNLYDSNGWYNGQIQDNFPFAFQPTSYPDYAADTLHGYANDEYLTEDGEVVLPLQKDFIQVLSIAQAQRLAKIALLRNRMQMGSGTLKMSLAAFALQPMDTFNMTCSQMGWTDKLLEVNSFQFTTDQTDAGPLLSITLGVNETDPTIYDWSVAEELTVYDVPAAPSLQAPYTPAPPTDMELISSAATALLQPDGSVAPRIQVNWTTPLDILVTQIQVQYQPVGAANWTDAGSASVNSNFYFISGVVSGQQYDVRIRSIRGNGATSVWVELDGFTAGLVLSVQTQDGVGKGSLVGEAYPDGTAAIECNPFTALVGQLSLPVFPGGAVTISGLTQQTLYYVYYIDPTYVGGNVTPIATTNQSDFLGKLGYFLIDSIVTPFAGSGGGGGGTGTNGGKYQPTTFSELGTRTTTTPAAAYDGNLSSYATVSGSSTSTFAVGKTSNTTAIGSGAWSGFNSVVAAANMTLTVICTTILRQSATSPSGSVSINASLGGSTTSPLANSAGNLTTYTLTVPTGTNLSGISVFVNAVPGVGGASSSVPSASSSVQAQVAEIYIQ